MKIAEIFESKFIAEGGSLPGVGAIHISEIKPTLGAIQKKLGIDLLSNTLGSVGKWEFSGDIDVAIDIDRESIPAFVEKLQSIPEIQDIKRSSVIMTKVKIQNYDPSISTDRERTGYVQLDFMPGDPDWMKTFYHSPSQQESKYKGVYRNILLSIIAGHYQRKDSAEQTDDGRPLESERFLFSEADGLVRIIRRPAPKKNGSGYTKSNTKEIVAGPWKDNASIAKILKLGGPETLNSYETLITAVRKNYHPALVKQIEKDMRENSLIQQKGIPDDL